MSILCIIPARSGSKGIPLKNMVKLGNRPLISYSIDIAKKLKSDGFVKKAIISTDSKLIANFAIRNNIEVPFLRPIGISGDKAKSIDFVLHALDYYQNKDVHFNSVLILQPTSPFREYEEVANAISLFLRSDEDSLISAYQEDVINELVMYKINGEKGIPFNSRHNQGVRRQEHEKIFIRNGAIYITNVKYLKTKKKIISDFPLVFKMKKSTSINIDLKEDLFKARKLVKKLNFK